MSDTPIPDLTDLGVHVVPDAEMLARALIGLRGEFTTAYTAVLGRFDTFEAVTRAGAEAVRMDLRNDISRVESAQKLGFLEVTGAVQETQRLQRATNGTVKKHDDLLGAHAKWHEDEALAETIRRTRMEEWRKPVRVAWQTWRFVSSNTFVNRAALTLIGGYLAGKEVGLL